MCEALDDHEGSVSIGGRLITTFCFVDDIIVNAEEEKEAGVLVDRLDTTTTEYNMEIGPDKTKLMTKNPNGFQREIKIKVQRLDAILSSVSFYAFEFKRASTPYHLDLEFWALVICPLVFMSVYRKHTVYDIRV